MMSNKLSEVKINATKWFWMFCTIHLFFWTLLPTIFRNNVPFDTIEGIAWGNQWQWGYDKHPPLAAWFSALATHLGGAVGWPVYLLAQIAIVVTFWAVWRLGRKILTPVSALVAVMLLEAVMYFGTSLIIKFNPTTLMSPLWALAILVFYSAVTKQKMWQWLLLGFVAGLCMLAKYESAMLLFAMLIFLLVTSQGRASFKNWGLYLSGVLFFIVVAPNLFWVMKHHFSEVAYALGSLSECRLHPAILNHIYYPFLFFIIQIAVMVPLLLVAIPLFLAPKSDRKIEPFVVKFLLIVGLGPFLLTILFSIVTGSDIYGKWATPYFTMVGIILLVWLRPVITKKVFTRFVIIIALLFTVIVGTRYLYIYYGPNMLGISHYPDAYYPGNKIAVKLTRIWHQHYNKRLLYVAGDRYLVANIVAYSSDRPTPYFSWSKNHSAWVNEQQMRKYGALFAWHVRDHNHGLLPRNIAKRFPSNKYVGVFVFPETNKYAKPVKIAVALLPPARFH